MGGLARRATIEERIKKDADGVLIVDAGDNLTGPAVAPPAKLARARFIMDASRKLGVDAMALGEKDHESGLDEKELSTVHGSAIVTRAGIKIGVFSVDLMAPDADKVFAREAANVRKQGAKLSVALMHGAAIKAKELLTSGASSVDIAVMSHESGWGAPIARAGHTWYVQIPPQGKFVGQLDLHIIDGKLQFVDIGGRSSLELSVQDTEREIADLGRKYPDSGPLADFGKKRRAELSTLLAQQKAEVAAYPNVGQVKGSWLEAKNIPLGADIPDEPEMATMLKRHKQLVSAQSAPTPMPVAIANAAAAASPFPPGYAGSDACMPCHDAAVKQWKTTKHAQAWAALVRKESDKDPSCVQCHITGGATNLVSVQCEACHGPSLAHTKNPAVKGQTVRSPLETTCTTCHRKPQAQEWEFTSFRKATLGPGHGFPLAGTKK